MPEDNDPSIRDEDASRKNYDQGNYYWTKSPASFQMLPQLYIINIKWYTYKLLNLMQVSSDKTFNK